MQVRKLVALALLAVLAGFRTAAFAQDNPPTGSLRVSDQPIVNGMITVTEVVASHDGWVAVREFGPAGAQVVAPVVGLTAVKAGTTSNVQVALTKLLEPGTKLAAMLHIDAGTSGAYEFPNGPDVPVSVGDNVVMVELTIQGDDAGADATAPAATGTVAPAATGTVAPAATDTAAPAATDTAVPAATDAAMPAATDMATPAPARSPTPSPDPAPAAASAPDSASPPLSETGEATVSVGLPTTGLGSGTSALLAGVALLALLVGFVLSWEARRRTSTR